MIRWPLGIPSDLVVELASDDILYVLVETNNQENQATNNFNYWGVNIDNVVFINTDTYSHWTRDYGPQFVIGEEYWKVVNQLFNGYPVENGCQENFFFEDDIYHESRPLPPELRGWEEDDNTNIDFANQMNWEIQNLPLYFTGGNFMTDGYGMGFSTELMVNENNIDNNEFQQIVSDELFLSNYHIFDNPNVSSIQHIDCMAKLVNSETIIIKQVPETSPEYDCTENFANSFYELNTFYGRPFNIYRLYCPEINGGWWELNSVAAYTNSLILNGKVLVPQYGIPEDIQALQIYQDAMPGYEIIGFNNDTGNPWYGEDALHCRTMGVFDPSMMHISHKSIRIEDIASNQTIYVQAEIVDYGDFDTNLESVVINWKYSVEDGPFNQFNLESESNNIYTGTFPDLNSNSLIEYFITATNFSNNRVSHPNAGWHTFNTLGQEDIELTIEYNSGWNLIGLPLNTEYTSYNIIFPESIEGTLYSFNNGYNLETSLLNSVGYWLRFNGEGSTDISGIQINELTINLNEGWNLISGISTSINILEVQDPGEIIIISTLYKFDSYGYTNTENIEPGKGYWLRANNSGSITLTNY